MTRWARPSILGDFDQMTVTGEGYRIKSVWLHEENRTSLP